MKFPTNCRHVCETELNVSICPSPSSSSSLLSIPEVRKEMAHYGAFSQDSIGALQVTMIAAVRVADI